MEPIKSDLKFNSFQQLVNKIDKAESVQFRSDKIVIKSKSHKTREIAKIQLHHLALDLARNKEVPEEEKLKLFENAKHKLVELSPAGMEDVMTDIDNQVEFVRQKPKIEQDLRLQASKIKDWLKSEYNKDLVKIDSLSIPKIHEYLLRVVPLSRNLDKDTWFEIVNKQVFDTFRQLIPKGKESEYAHYALPIIGDLNLHLLDPLPMTKISEELKEKIPGSYHSSFEHLLAPYLHGILKIDDDAQFKAEDISRMEWNDFQLLKAFCETSDISSLISSLQNQLDFCNSFLQERVGDTLYKDLTYDNKLRYDPYEQRRTKNKALIKLLTSYEDWTSNRVLDGGFNLFEALAKTIRDPNERDVTRFSQSDIISSHSNKPSKKLNKIQDKYDGLCEIICNKILIDQKLGEDHFFDYLKNEMVLSKLDQPKYVDTHILEVSGILDIAKFVLLKSIPGSVISPSQQSKICQQKKVNDRTETSINDEIFEKVVEKMEINKPLKIFTYKLFDRKHKQLIYGHSLLMMKTGENSYIFFDPNYGRFKNLTKDELKEKIEDPLNTFGLNKLVIVDAEELMKKFPAS